MSPELSEVVKKYKGGGAEIRSLFEGCRYRGEVATITVVDGTIRVVFSWLLKCPDGSGERATDRSMFVAPLELYNVEFGNGELFLTSSITGQTAQFLQQK
jgi:hypothetical protein